MMGLGESTAETAACVVVVEDVAAAGRHIDLGGVASRSLVSLQRCCRCIWLLIATGECFVEPCCGNIVVVR